MAMAANASLDGPRAKVSQAGRHRDRLGAALRSWFDREPYSIDAQLDRTTGWIQLYLREKHAPPIELGLIFGDFVNNLRSALDHLAWQLVLLSGATPSSSTGFPIIKSEASWEKASKARMRGVRSDLVDQVRAVQPFHDGPRASAHPIALLDYANNVNKHRVISPYATLGVRFAPPLIFNRRSTGAEQLKMQIAADTRLTDGALLGRVRVESDNNDFYITGVGPIHVDELFVGFDIGGDGKPRSSEVFASVERVIALFEPFFGG